jgi:hypothetical protein
MDPLRGVLDGHRRYAGKSSYQRRWRITIGEWTEPDSQHEKA